MLPDAEAAILKKKRDEVLMDRAKIAEEYLSHLKEGPEFLTTFEAKRLHGEAKYYAGYADAIDWMLFEFCLSFLINNTSKEVL